MKLENGYKVLYAIPTENEVEVKASKTGLFDDAEKITAVAKGAYKLVYGKDGKIFGSKENIPTDDDTELALDEVFVKKAEGTTTTESTEQPKQDEVENTPDEGQDNGQEDDDETEVPSEEE